MMFLQNMIKQFNNYIQKMYGENILAFKLIDILISLLKKVRKQKKLTFN